MYGQVFFYQRVCIVVALVFIDPYALQFIVVQHLILAKLVYLASVKPYLTLGDSLPDLANEILLLIIHLSQVWISPLITNDSDRYEAGKVFGYLLVAIFVFNIGLVVYKSVLVCTKKQQKK